MMDSEDTALIGREKSRSNIVLVGMPGAGKSTIGVILAKHTSAEIKKIEKDCDRNLWLDPTEAMEYGLVDKILERQPAGMRGRPSDDD